jgi:membrane-bound inhibitor of C-type lysozyme
MTTRKATWLRLAALPLATVVAMALSAAARAQSYVHYECEGGAHFELTFFPDTKAAFLQLDGKSIRLPQSASITGTRYRKDGITVWVKGERATLRRAGKRIECKVK